MRRLTSKTAIRLAVMVSAVAVCALMTTGCNPAAPRPVAYAAPDTVGSGSLLAGLAFRYYWGPAPVDGRHPRFQGRSDTVGILDSLTRLWLPRYDKDTINISAYDGYVLIPGNGDYAFSAVDTTPGSRVSVKIDGSDAARDRNLSLAAGYHAISIQCVNVKKPQDLRVSATGNGRPVSLNVFCRKPVRNEYVVEMFTPVSGAKYHPGDTIRIQFTADPQRLKRVYFYLSVDGGLGYYSLSSDPAEYEGPNAAWWGNYPWVVKDSLKDNTTQTTFTTVSAACSIRGSSYGGEAANADYSGVFEIANQ